MIYNEQNCINSFVLVQGQVNRNVQLVLNENVPVGQVGHETSTALLDESITFGQHAYLKLFS